MKKQTNQFFVEFHTTLDFIVFHIRNVQKSRFPFEDHKWLAGFQELKNFVGKFIDLIVFLVRYSDAITSLKLTTQQS